MKVITPGLRVTFLVHLIAALIFGLGYLLIPDMFANITGLKMLGVEPMLYRLIGAAILGYGMSSYLAYRETEWLHVRIVVAAEIVWTWLATVIELWAILFLGLPLVTGLNLIIMAAFAIAFTYFYFAENRLPVSQAPGHA